MMIFVDDAQKIILENLFSEDTNKYLDNTVMTTPEEKRAFIQGMNYAALLIAVKCFKFDKVSFDAKEIDAYNEFIKEKGRNNSP